MVPTDVQHRRRMARRHTEKRWRGEFWVPRRQSVTSTPASGRSLRNPQVLVTLCELTPLCGGSVGGTASGEGTPKAENM